MYGVDCLILPLPVDVPAEPLTNLLFVLESCLVESYEIAVISKDIRGSLIATVSSPGRFSTCSNLAKNFDLGA